MLGAYSTFGNFGNYVKPEMIWRIEDANGRVMKSKNRPKEWRTKNTPTPWLT